jgi:Domain of unknown function (DUF4410)
MKQLSVARWCVVVGFVVGAAGCSGASWQKVSVSPSYQAPKQLRVSLVAEASSEDSAIVINAMQSALAAGLASKGITVTFVAAPSGGPEANVTIAEWDPGSRALRYFVGFGAGQASIVVVVKSPSADGQPGVEGIARGWINAGFFGGDSEVAATEAGHLIADAIATGQTN